MTKSDVVRDVTGVTRSFQRFLKLSHRFFVLLFLVEDASLSYDSFGLVLRHLTDQTLSVRHLFKLILDVHLQLRDFLSIFRRVNLLSNFGCLQIHASLEETLRMVESILGHVRVQLAQLVVHVCGLRVILNVEVAVGE